MTTPQSFSGLGIRCARDNNIIMISKLSWDIINGATKLWVFILQSKYLKHESIFTHSTPAHDLPCGKGLAKVLVFWHNGYSWRLGDGSKISFWSDKWATLTSFANMLGPPTASVSNLTVGHFITNERTWDLDTLRHELPQFLVDHVLATPIASMQSIEDKLIW